MQRVGERKAGGDMIMGGPRAQQNVGLGAGMVPGEYYSPVRQPRGLPWEVYFRSVRLHRAVNALGTAAARMVKDRWPNFWEWADSECRYTGFFWGNTVTQHVPLQRLGPGQHWTVS